MRYRTFLEPDFSALQDLDLELQRQDPAFDTLPAREREGRVHTSLAALKFYSRSEHSFLAEDSQGIHGFVLAQHVWQGDKPIVLIRTLSVHPAAPAEVTAGLLHATVKSAYDTAVYELHFPITPHLQAAAQAEETVTVGQYGVCHLGSRAETSPGVRIGTPPNEGP